MDFYVFVFKGGPSLYQEAMGVVVRPAHVAQDTLSNEAAGNCAGGTYDVLGGIAPEVIRVLVNVYCYAVDGDFLADIAGYDVCIVPILFKVVVFALR